MLNALRIRIDRVPRLWKRLLLVAFDFVALSGALYVSYALRYGEWAPPTSASLLGIMVTAPIVAIPIFIRMGLYRAVIRYLPEKALWTIVQAMTLAAICWVVVAFISELVVHGFVPRSVPFIYWLLGTVIIVGSRYAAKAVLGEGLSLRQERRPVLIYGAGQAGVQLAQALRGQRSSIAIGFIDESRGLAGHDVSGIRVYAPSQLAALIEQYGIREVILSEPLGFQRRQEIVEQLGSQGVKIRTLPSLAEVAQGRYLVNQIREIDIDELLGRSSVPPDAALLKSMIEGRSIMVTGAGGSIGSELCRLVARLNPSRLVLLEANEFALYTIDRELADGKGTVLHSVLGSVTDTSIVRKALVDHDVEVVFHAAAHKHVPLIESNALEGIRNNVLGAAILADLALTAGVKNFVLISSDKAVRPTNVMGATKRWAELIMWQKSREALQRNSGQRFSVVRFGNVLGSNGSVVPLFKDQIARGGPITLTDPNMTRYFMSIHEAAELIVQAAGLSDGGDVFLLEMGNPIQIKELAENMVHLAGLTVRDGENPDGDIEFVVTGKRPGEKIHEELFYDRSRASVTQHPKILRAMNDDSRVGDIEGAIAQMRELLAAQDEAAARKLLFGLIEPAPVN